MGGGAVSASWVGVWCPLWMTLERLRQMVLVEIGAVAHSPFMKLAPTELWYQALHWTLDTKEWRKYDP